MLSPILQHVVINNNAGYAYIPRHPANRKHHPLYRHRSKDRLKRFTLSAIRVIIAGSVIRARLLARSGTTLPRR